MLVRVHGFDWKVYRERIMPAFAHWLVDGDDSIVHQLYEQTRSAEGEKFVPAAVQHLCTWPRAQAFVKQLPRGPQARREYQNLCTAELFLALSDIYMHQYPPRLYQNSEALRTVWGAVVEQFCLPWFQLTPVANPATTEDKTTIKPAPASEPTDSLSMNGGELISLLQSAGLDELAQHINAQFVTRHDDTIYPTSNPSDSIDTLTLDETHLDEGRDAIAQEDDDGENGPPGIVIGRHPTTLHLRGWLARHSVRAMALFEYLTCGRRSMPFGYQAGKPFEAYIGYLTPDEVWQMALCMADVQPPDPAQARADYRNFRIQHSEDWDEFRLIDEVLPVYGGAFLQAVDSATQQGLGLICHIG